MEALATNLAIGVLIALSQAFQVGLTALQNKQYDPAIAALTQVVDQRVPGNHWQSLALYYRAQAHHAKGDEKAARQDLSALLSGHVPEDIHAQALALHQEVGGELGDYLPPRQPPEVWAAFMAACQKGDVEAAMAYCTETHRALYAMDPSRYQAHWEGLANNVIGAYHVLAYRAERLGARVVCLLALQNEADTLYRVDMLKVGTEWQIASVEWMRGYADPEINWVRLHRLYQIIEMYHDQRNGELPVSLDRLITSGALSRREAQWRHPQTGDEALFAYCDSLESLEDPPRLLVASPQPVDGYRLVLFSDGKVRALAEDDFVDAAREQGWRAPGLVKPGEVTADQRRYIEELVEQLGAADYSTRHTAEEKLKEIGKAAEPFLDARQDADDPEIRLTVRRLLDAMSP